MKKKQKMKSSPGQLTSTANTPKTKITDMPEDCFLEVGSFVHNDLSSLVKIANTCKEFLHNIQNLLYSDSKSCKKIKLDFSLLNIKEENIKDKTKIILQKLLDDLLYVRNIAIPQEYSEETIYKILEIFNQKKYGYLNELNIHESHIQNFNKFAEFFKNLKKLNINFCQQIKDETLKYFKNIQILDLSGCENITSEGLKHLVSVYDLNLSYCKNITSEGLKYLKSVRQLDLTSCSQIENLDKLNSKNLKVLKLIGCKKLSKINWYDFKRDQCPNLKILIKPDGKTIDFAQEEERKKAEEERKKAEEERKKAEEERREKLKQTIENFFQTEKSYRKQIQEVSFYTKEAKFFKKNYLGLGEMQI